MSRSTAPVLLLCGYYGEHNLGDDALLQVLLQSLPKHASLKITAHDQDEVQLLAPQAHIIRRRSLWDMLTAALEADILILGGGSLLQDGTSFHSLLYYLALITLTRLRRRRVLLWGQGLGPLHRALSRWLVHGALSFCTAASWRDPGSFELARRWAPNLPMRMAADPVWQMPSQDWVGGGAIILSWRLSDLLDAIRWRTLLQALDGLASRLETSVCWMAFHRDQDSSLLKRLVQRQLVPHRLLARSTTMIPRSPNAVFELVKTARLVLPMRLHALILARLSGCPMIALSYDPKVESAAALAKVPCIRLDELPSVESLVVQWEKEVDREVEQHVIDQIRFNASAHNDILAQWV
ncbi:polysaccharide pyruvyl transferase CsaB [Synechococcus sp. M16CYN]|uniref:polysaccharide pyruvyl transferase CsaB n=1 Tax=Synechococcus sp. M16CYN TaxID=3103139 RepID=UPI00324D263A